MNDPDIARLKETIHDHHVPIKIKQQAMDKLETYVLEKREENTNKAIESGRLDIYRKLRVPERKIEIELSEHGIGNSPLSPFPFFLMKRSDKGIGIETITFHEYPKAHKVLREYITSWVETEDYLVNESLINRWLDDEGYNWFHVDDFDVLPSK
ncbi:hypothetical protein WJ0W_006715 [Paenibacillus melissococcoides]|uniref:Uncharacterized protein n=1 Tax=Paenibacillus melissococcoides TaxID=2912268 RepID=A0ABM9GBI4_9BACL|nr:MULTISPECIES: hypothetical protein [Paenibacillus]MEB9895009.1 hypothetical protein [Bacillus cereus]CAH8249530.1 hypothetical protein WJ0W_006715 [Paenibacillus melissococcoides]CAH8721127.1 hypothetical protein HTL2_006203 [Paenibacillus melissococcoides]